MSNWANRTKAALTTVDASNLKPVGGQGGGAISKFYRMTAPKDASDPKSAQLVSGQAILGLYKGSFVTKNYGTTFYKIETTEGLVAVPGSGQLNKLMEKVAEGAQVQITYKGKETISQGKFAGKEAHSFLVAASELKA